MSDSTDWKFDPDELGSDDDDSSSSGSDSSFDGGSIGTGIILLPFSVLGALAFVQKATVLTAFESVFGSGLVAAAVTNAFWVIGVVLAVLVGGVTLATVAGWLGALARRSTLAGVVAALGTLYLGAGVAGAVFLFGGMPLFVGFFLTTSLLIGVVVGLGLSVSGIIIALLG